MTCQTNVVPHSDHNATKHSSVRRFLRARITASAMLALFHLLLQNLVWTIMLIPANAASENQKVVRFVHKITQKLIDCANFCGRELPPVLWRVNQIYRSNHCFNFLFIKGWLKQYTHTFCIGSFISALSVATQRPESCLSNESNCVFDWQLWRLQERRGL